MNTTNSIRAVACMTFADQLQAARAAAGLSQSQAALPLISAGILGSVRTLQNWEAGRGETLPAYKQAAALAALRSPKRPRKQKGQNDDSIHPESKPPSVEEPCEDGLGEMACSRLRRTLCNVLLALGNGAACSQDASIEFMEMIPAEVEAARKKWERNHDRELAHARKAAAALADAAQLVAEIMRDEVNHQDEAEKWLRAYAPQHLFPENAPTVPTEGGEEKP